MGHMLYPEPLILTIGYVAISYSFLPKAGYPAGPTRPDLPGRTYPAGLIHAHYVDEK